MNYLTIQQAIHDRAASDAAGATLRGLLGGASSVFTKERLAYVAAATTLPWLVFSGGPVGGASGDMRDCQISWWAYAAPAAGATPLLNIVSALDALYGHANAYAITGGRMEVAFIGQVFRDDKLDLNGVEVRVVYHQRG